MTNFFLRHFVRDYKNITDVKVRTAYGILASTIGICCNVFLFIVKLTIGTFLNSISVISDAFNNLSDAASSIISFIGVKMAEKPADKEHPFGHGRIEYIAALIVSFLVIEVGWTFLKSAIEKIKTPEAISFSIISTVILILSIAVKLWLAYFNRKLGKQINSSVMKATAADSLGDVIITSATIVSIIVYGIFHWNIDGYIGLIVSIVVIIAGINIAKETLAPLIGAAVDPKLSDEITKFVEQYDGIIGTHDLIVHNYGPSKSMASIHAEVPSDIDILTSHEIIDDIERDAMKKLGIFLVIHMDPVAIHDERVKYFRGLVMNIIHKIDDSITMHDFRFVYGVEHINLIFDIVVASEYTQKDINKIKKDIGEQVEKEDPRCHCVINVDKSFTGD